MASNWLRQTTNNYENKRNPILLAFIIFQAFLILIIVIAVIYLNSKNAPEDDATYYKNTPELAIKNLKEKLEENNRNCLIQNETEGQPLCEREKNVQQKKGNRERGS